jgi:hypothetical protein
MIKSKTKVSVDSVSYISTWGTIDFQTEDGSVEISLTDEQVEDLAECLTKRAQEAKERKLNKMREELEKVDNAETND